MKRTGIGRGWKRLRKWLPLGIGLLAFACGPAEPIRLGFLGGISGRVADLGMAGRDGAQLAVDLRNQAGGVDGRKVLLLVKDDEQNHETAKREAKALIDQGVRAIIGPMTSDMAKAVIPVVEKAKIVCVSPTATTEELSGKDDYFFRTTSTTRIFATASANYLLKTDTMRRVATAYDLGNRSFSEMWIDNFAKALTAGGGEVLAKIGFQSGEGANYNEIARRLLAAQPDGIAIAANAVDSSLLCQQIRKLNPDLPIALSDWAAQERLIELGGKAVEGVIVVQTFDRNSTAPRYLEFRRLYMERFGREPGFAGTYSFDAANLVLDAMANQGTGTLKEALLAARQYQGAQGDVTMDEYGDINQLRCSISVVKDGEFVVVE